MCALVRGVYTIGNYVFVLCRRAEYGRARGLRPQCGDCAPGFRHYDETKVVILIVMMMCDVMFLFVFYLLWRVLATGG